MQIGAPRAEEAIKATIGSLKAKARSRRVVSSARRSTSSVAAVSRASAADWPERSTARSRSPPAEREGEGQLPWIGSRLSPDATRSSTSLTHWPAVDHVGGKGAGVMLTQGVAMRIVHVRFRPAHERSADTSFQYFNLRGSTFYDKGSFRPVARPGVFWNDRAAGRSAARAGCRSLCPDEGNLPLAEPQFPHRNLTAPHQSVTAA